MVFLSQMRQYRRSQTTEGRGSASQAIKQAGGHPDRQIDSKVVSAADNPVDTAKFSLVMYLFKICPVALGTQHEADANPAATLYEKLELVGMSTTGVVPSCFGAGGLVKSNTYFK